MMDLIEHVPAPLALLDTAWHLLRPGGILVVYTPNHRSLIAQLALVAYKLSSGAVRGPAYTIFGTNHVCFFDHRSLPEALLRAGYILDVMYHLKYDPGHQGEIEDRSALALGIKSVEMLGQVTGRPYRLLAFVRRPPSIPPHAEGSWGSPLSPPARGGRQSTPFSPPARGGRQSSLSPTARGGGQVDHMEKKL